MLVRDSENEVASVWLLVAPAAELSAAELSAAELSAAELSAAELSAAELSWDNFCMCGKIFSIFL